MSETGAELVEFLAIVGVPAGLVSAGAMIAAVTGETAVGVVALYGLWVVVFTHQLCNGRWTDRGAST
jgi:hypothetical protein